MTFNLNEERYPACNQLEQLTEVRNMLPTVEKLLAGNYRRRRGFDCQSRGAKPSQVMIVEHHYLAVNRQADIAFDAGARFHCCAERRQAVFGNAGAVKPAMR